MLKLFQSSCDVADVTFSLALDVAECTKLSILGLVAADESRTGEFESVDVAISSAAVGI